jgi:hypothetical protein
MGTGTAMRRRTARLRCRACIRCGIRASLVFVGFIFTDEAGVSWVFWFRQQRTPGNKIVSYEDGIKRVAAFSSVRLFKLYVLH